MNLLIKNVWGYLRFVLCWIENVIRNKKFFFVRFGIFFLDRGYW